MSNKVTSSTGGKRKQAIGGQYYQSGLEDIDMGCQRRKKSYFGELKMTFKK